MRRMAGHAVFLHGGMFPEHRGLLLGVALVALVVDGLRGYQLLAAGAVRVMAGGTFHRAFAVFGARVAQWVLGALGHIGFHVLVAGKAEFALGFFGEEVFAVDFVAGNAAIAFTGVLAAFPEHPVPVGGVAGQAGFGSFFSRRFGRI